MQLMLSEDTQTLVVIGLVSNGKSTLVNALIEASIMPTSNIACTAVAATVVDPVSAFDFPEACYRRHGMELQIIQKQIHQELQILNEHGGGEVWIRSPLTKINRGRFPLAIVDTPGVNDGLTSEYSEIAIDSLRKAVNPTVLFVSHVHTCGTTDEEKCLLDISQVMKERGLTEWFVAVNGWNYFDPEQETKEEYIQKIEYMAQKCGLPKPRIFCVAALHAQLCGKVIHGESLSGSERIQLEAYLRSIRLYPQGKKHKCNVEKLGNKLLRTAIHYAGIVPLERALYQHLAQRHQSAKETAADSVPAGETPVHIYALGYSSGKSTLLNALLGNRIMPPVSTTIPTYIHVDNRLDTFRCEIFRRDGRSEPQGSVSPKGLKKLYLADRCRGDDIFQKELHLYGPAENLRDCQAELTFVESPAYSLEVLAEAVNDQERKVLIMVFPPYLIYGKYHEKLLCEIKTGLQQKKIRPEDVLFVCNGFEEVSAEICDFEKVFLQELKAYGITAPNYCFLCARTGELLKARKFKDSLGKFDGEGAGLSKTEEEQLCTLLQELAQVECGFYQYSSVSQEEKKEVACEMRALMEEYQKGLALSEDVAGRQLQQERNQLEKQLAYLNSGMPILERMLHKRLKAELPKE